MERCKPIEKGFTLLVLGSRVYYNIFQRISIDYRRSFVDTELGEQAAMAIRFTFSFAKAKAALLHLAQKNLTGFSKGKACKLLFLSDKRHLVQYGRPITGDWYVAMDHGPVPSSILDLLDAAQSGVIKTEREAEIAACIRFDRSFEYPPIHALEPPDLDDLSESDIESLDAIVQEHGHKSFTELRNLTHGMPAYEKAWSGRSGASAPMSFELFFEEDEDAVAGVVEEVIENGEIRKVFPEPAWF